MSNIFTNIFKPTPAPTVTPVQPAPGSPTPAAQPVNLANTVPEVVPVQTPGTAPNGVVPDIIKEPVSPLDAYKELWQTDPNAKPTPEFSTEMIDPAKLQEIVSNTNMTAALTPELSTRISAGGEDAQVAVMEAMNIVAQQTLAQSTTVANKMMESNSKKMMDAMLAKLPGLIKEQGVTNSLIQENPIFSNPAVAPVIDGVKTQLQAKFPNATAPELTKMAKDFVVTMSEALNPAPATPSPLDAEVDWSGFDTE